VPRIVAEQDSRDLGRQRIGPCPCRKLNLPSKKIFWSAILFVVLSGRSQDIAKAARWQSRLGKLHVKARHVSTPLAGALSSGRVPLPPCKQALSGAMKVDLEGCSSRKQTNAILIAQWSRVSQPLYTLCMILQHGQQQSVISWEWVLMCYEIVRTRCDLFWVLLYLKWASTV